MIICLEGPSAVGKTSTSLALQSQWGATHIPEVNALFERPASPPENWYLERQAERWRMACQTQATQTIAVLDGDPFQPFWYNWSYEFGGWQSLEQLAAFYRPRIASGAMGFPDRYVVLFTDAEELRRRKELDSGRLRRGFDKHLRLIETQRRYFEAVAHLAPDLVQIIPADSIEDNLRHIREYAVSTPGTETLGSLALFEAIIVWLRENKAEQPSP